MALTYLGGPTYLGESLYPGESFELVRPAWQPTPRDVRNEMLGRDLEQITDEQLQHTLDRITTSLLAEAPAVDSRWAPVAAAYVLYAAATQVELRLFPEQQTGSDSQSARYDQLAGAELTRLRAGLDPATESGGEPTGAFTISPTATPWVSLR